MRFTNVDSTQRPTTVPPEARRRARLAVARPSCSGGPALAQQPPARADAVSRGVLTAPHFPPKAKRVIYLHMLGAVSQVDTFDYKPMLEKMHGQELPRVGARHRAAVDDGRGADVVSDRRPARQVQAGRQERHDGQRPDAAHARHRRRPLPSSGRCTPSTSTTIRRRSSCTPASRLPAGRRAAPGSTTRSAPNNQDLPTFVVMSSGNVQRRADRRGGLGRRVPALALPGRAVPVG